MGESGVTGDKVIVSWFSSNEYNSQSNDHVNAMCEAFLEDLVGVNEVIRDAAAEGGLVYERNFSLAGPTFLGNVDLVIGPPAQTEGQQKQLQTTSPRIPESSVEEVWLALNIESLISSINKNWTNRARDVHSFYLSLYDNHPTALTGSIVLFNVTDLVDRNPESILGAFREFEIADGSLAQRLDRLAVIALERAISNETTLASDLIPEEDPLGYDPLVRTLADGLTKRIQGDFDISEATLEALLTHSESDQLEFKEEVGDSNQDVAKEAVALANREGGRIIYGVADDGSVLGLSDIAQEEERVSRILRDSISPNVIGRIEQHSIDGNTVLEVRVNRMTGVPASCNGIFYIRTGTTTSKLTGREILDLFPRE